ncbi:MAG: sporulation protein YtfJ [Ruminococcaceae bacterium]|nr:sporulation protein YtfJ [Oscillospiraceae bacterium]
MREKTQEQNNEKNKISELIKESLGSVREFLDANTVTGTPIETASGTVIIPISKISMGFAGGGNDYAGKNASAKQKNNFGGGGGTGVSVVPIGFLVVDSEGKVEMININNPGNDIGSSIESIVEKLPAIMDKLKETFEKKKAEKEEKKAEEATENAENTENAESKQEENEKTEKSFEIKSSKTEEKAE